MRSRSPGRRLREDLGSVTAEFAAVVPAVVFVLVGCIAGLHVAGQQLLLQDAAADAARIIARGEPAGAAESHAQGLVPGAVLARFGADGLECVSLSAPAAARGPLAALSVTAQACALGGGR